MFCNLHTHTDYSVLDGMMTVKVAFDTAKSRGYSALGITEHANLSSLFIALKESDKSGIKYVPGVEFNFVNESSAAQTHLVVLASSHSGLKSIMRLVYQSCKNDIKSPHIVWDDLSILDRSGVFVLSACSEGLLARQILFYGINRGEMVADKFSMIFGERFLIEYNVPCDRRQVGLNDALYDLAKSKGIRDVVTLDSHYATLDDADLFPVFLAIQHKGNIYSNDSLFYDRRPLLSEAEIRTIMPEKFYGAIAESHKLAEKCADPLTYLKTPDKFMMPEFDITSTDDYQEFLKYKEQNGGKFRLRIS